MRCALVFVAVASCGARTELDAPVNDCAALLASGSSWQTSFGPARPVCLDASHPKNCPNDAFVYGGGVGGWNADISSLGGAAWIWRPGLSKTDIADGVEVTFTRTFLLSGAASGTISIAADDFAQVVVNGEAIGTIGSTTDKASASAAQSALSTFDLGPQLVSGTNTVEIIARNGPASFACGVFGGRLACH